jgi:hypothetical protein
MESMYVRMCVLFLKPFVFRFHSSKASTGIRKLVVWHISVEKKLVFRILNFFWGLWNFSSFCIRLCQLGGNRPITDIVYGKFINLKLFCWNRIILKLISLLSMCANLRLITYLKFNFTHIIIANHLKQTLLLNVPFHPKKWNYTFSLFCLL